MTEAPAASRWTDLGPRAASAVVMIALGVAAVILGGVWFQMLAVFVTAVMVWELWTMIEPERPIPGMLLAALVASVLSGQLTVQEPWGLLLFLIAPVAGSMATRRQAVMLFGFALAIQVAGWGLVTFRAEQGWPWLVWLIGLVVATDVAGYFAGRLIGGPKIVPRLSPKKTWSGTVAGWLAAAAVGALAMGPLGVGVWLIAFSALVSFASQVGDVTESALKRRVGVKDASQLIPGHGGMFDRFDALLGASIFMLAWSALVGLPGPAA